VRPNLEEEWRRIPFNGNYEVSNLGNVRSWINNRGETRREPRLLTQSRNHRRYHVVGLAGRQYRVHRLVALAFLGEGRPGEIVRHLDDNKSNNRLANLAWGSHTDNAADRIANGNQHRPAGMKHHRATLTDEIVRLIRARREAGASLLEIQGEFDVDYRRVSAICLRKSWAHVA
jgi:hypothetical protein